MPGCGEGVVVGAPRLLGQEHGEALVAGSSFGLVRASSVIMSLRAAWVIQVLLPVMR